MGRKRETPADKRRDYLTPEVLRHYADALSQEAARLHEQANKIDKAEVKELYVDGVRKFPNAFPDIEGFVNNVAKAMLDARIR